MSAGWRWVLSLPATESPWVWSDCWHQSPTGRKRGKDVETSTKEIQKQPVDKWKDVQDHLLIAN